MAKEKGKKKILAKIATYILLLILLSILGGMAYFGFSYFYKKERMPELSFKYITLKEEILAFSFKMIPDTFAGMVEIDSDITLIDQEIDRLTRLIEQYPKQQKIIAPEKNKWLKTKKSLQTSLQNLEKNVEMIYVSYSVNTEKGLTTLEEKKEALQNEISKAIQDSEELITRLKIEEPGLIEKIKSIF